MKATKRLGVASLVILILGTISSFIGSVLMFLDREYVVVYDWYYIYGRYIRGDVRYEYSVDNPVSGAMPFVGFMLLLIALILLIAGIIRNKKLLIGSVVLSYVAQPLLFCSTLIMTWEYDLSIIGYYLCDVGGSLAFIANILMIVTLGLSSSENKKKMVQNASSSKSITEEAFYTMLKSAKESLDSGALTQEEFDREKERIMGLRNPSKKSEMIINDLSSKLQEINDMHKSGLLSDEEYNEERKKIIAKMS